MCCRSVTFPLLCWRGFFTKTDICFGSSSCWKRKTTTKTQFCCRQLQDIQASFFMIPSTLTKCTETFTQHHSASAMFDCIKHVLQVIHPLQSETYRVGVAKVVGVVQVAGGSIPPWPSTRSTFRSVEGRTLQIHNLISIWSKHENNSIMNPTCLFVL